MSQDEENHKQDFKNELESISLTNQQEDRKETKLETTGHARHTSSQQVIDSKEPRQKQNQKNQRCKCSFKQVVIYIAIILLIIGIVVLYLLYSPDIINELDFFFKWLQHNPQLGIFIYSLFYFLGLLCMFPQSWLTLAGAICLQIAFGIVVGSIICWVVVSAVITLTSSLTFLIARKCCKKCIIKCFLHRYKWTRALDNGLQTDGIKIMILLRISPIVPANILNYIMGTTKISFKKYFLGSLVSLFMNGFAIYLASSLEDLSDLMRGDFQGSPQYLAYLIIGTILSIGLLILLVLIARREIKKILAKEEANIQVSE